MINHESIRIFFQFLLPMVKSGQNRYISFEGADTNSSKIHNKIKILTKNIILAMIFKESYYQSILSVPIQDLKLSNSTPSHVNGRDVE